MARISLVEAYDNKDVIKQISDLKDAVGNLDTESVTGMVNDVNTLKVQMSDVNNTVQTQGQSISQLRGNNVTQVTLSENLGSITSALSRQDGTVLTSQSVNLKQVKTAVLVPGSSPNIFRLSLTLSDDSVIESNDIALQLETIEGQDIYMTAVELIEDTASHKLQVKVTRSDGSTVLSNNVTYDYPSVADAVTEGLVKSSSAEGNVTVNADATMTVNGFDAVKTRLTALENADEQMRTDVSNISADVETVEGNVTTLSETVTGLSETVASTDGRITQNTTDITQLKTDVSTNTTNLTTVRGDVTTLKANVNAMSPAVSQNTADISTLRTDVDDNAADISALEADMTGKVSTFQGTEYEGKILKVDATGNLVLADPSKSAAPTGLVSFYDWNGRLLHEYTTEEFLALGAMPALPVNNEFVHYQEWNWDWEHAVAEVNVNGGWLDVGATCYSADNKMHIFIIVKKDGYVYARGPAGNVVNWGDGTVSTFDGEQLHQYTQGGVYEISSDWCWLSGSSDFKILMTVCPSKLGVYSESVSPALLCNVLPRDDDWNSAYIDDGNMYWIAQGSVVPRTDRRVSIQCGGLPSIHSQAGDVTKTTYLGFSMDNLIVRKVSYEGCNTEAVYNVHTSEEISISNTGCFTSLLNGEIVKPTMRRGASITMNTNSKPCAAFKIKNTVPEGIYEDWTYGVNASGIYSVAMLVDNRNSSYTLKTFNAPLQILPLQPTVNSNPTYGGLVKALKGTTAIWIPSQREWGVLSTTSAAVEALGIIVMDCTDCTTVPERYGSAFRAEYVIIVVPDDLYDNWYSSWSNNGADTAFGTLIKQSEYKGILRIPILSDLLEDENF